MLSKIFWIKACKFLKTCYNNLEDKLDWTESFKRVLVGGKSTRIANLILLPGFYANIKGWPPYRH
ncbi:hypothetical protein AWU04_00150 [Streptococcus pyogenes]|nr:hypothetical protein STAB901_02400 [Streptococcus pyogenes STAB901]AIW12617.1 hypothetical protein STAB904_02580 [Streptococcus pyogenes]BAR43931.1 hypothetical protein SPYJRS4_0431 [Streptococcus pyogenes JRS4]APX41037.1 hypothetical protein A4265_08595 [Streptococcus pyogenes]OAC61727.1 hypothetical protein AWU04_00150 [Streptococcus pyogenes]